MKKVYSIFLILIQLLFWVETGHAVARAAILSGYGSSASRNNETFVEGPLMIQVKFDADLSYRFVLGLEHTRTIGIKSGSSGGSTNIAATNFVLKYHFLNGVPYNLATTSKNEFFSVNRYGISPYLGFGLGVGSASSKDENKAVDNSISMLAEFKGGAHWLFSRRWGVDTDLSYSFPVAGRGEIFLLTFGLGVFYNF